MAKKSDWWLNRRGLIILYRGQGEPTTRIISPVAREHGEVAGLDLINRMRRGGIESDEEFANLMAFYHSQCLPPTKHGLIGVGEEAVGGVAIPTTKIPGVAKHFAVSNAADVNQAVVYVIRLPRNVAIKVGNSGLAAESEHGILHTLL